MEKSVDITASEPIGDEGRNWVRSADELPADECGNVAPMTGPRVLIIGGGFGGIAAAKGLAGADVDVTVIDRRNHHLFQPLLYQVATAGLNPSNIAHPIRGILARQANARVLLAEVVAIDPDARHVSLDDGAELPYDYLVLATGTTHAYFGHDEWELHAPGLKTIEDALEVRRRVLLAFERAERAADPDDSAGDLTFVVVGGGPTGVETARRDRRDRVQDVQE